MSAESAWEVSHRAQGQWGWGEGKRSEGRTWDGLGTAGVGDADELVEQDGVLIVVPVAEDHGELLVV